MFGAVWTYDFHALLVIASAALFFVDLLPGEAVHLIDDPPNDVIGVTSVQWGEFPPSELRLCHLNVKPANDATVSRRGKGIQFRNSSSSMLVPTAKNFTVHSRDNRNGRCL